MPARWVPASTCAGFTSVPPRLITTVEPVESLPVPLPSAIRLGGESAWEAQLARLLNACGASAAFASETNRAVIETYAGWLRGMDPLETEKVWAVLYNALRDQGQRGLTVTALSGIDVALWDIKGKHFGVPAYQLLGGPCRDRARVYYHADAADRLTRKMRPQGVWGWAARVLPDVGWLAPMKGLLDSIKDEQKK